MNTRVPSISGGLAFMDQQYPGWRNRVDPKKLDIGDACNCVIAQATGRNYNDVVAELGIRNRAAAELGVFVIDDSPGPGYSPETRAAYRQLTAAWRAELQAA